MPSRRFFTMLLPAALTAVVATAPTLAQSSGSLNTAAQVNTFPESVLLTLDFDGGTAAEFVDAVRKAAGDSANIVGDERLAYLPMPAVELKNVSVQSALRLLDGAEFSGGGSEHFARLEMLQSHPSELPVHSIQIRSRVVREPQSQETDMGVWPALGIMEHGLTADDILTSVQIALEMAAAGENEQKKLPAIRFHEQTGLLIVYGTPHVLAQVERVMDAIEESARQRAQSHAESVRERMSQIEHEVVTSREQAAQLAEVNQAMAMEMAAREAAMRTVEAELVRRTDEVERSRQMLVELERRAAQLQAELEAVRQRQQREPSGGAGGGGGSR